MFGIIRFIILFIVIVGGIGFIVYTMAKFYLALAPNSTRIKKEFGKIKNLLAASKSELIPFEDKEFSLMSGQFKEVSERGYTIGTFSTIYSEPLITYGYYNFVGNERSVLVAETSKHTFEFNFLDNHIDVMLNGAKLGQIDSKGIQAEKDDFEYEFKDHLESEFVHITYKEALVGQVIQSTTSHSINSRAVNIEKDKTNYNEPMFLAATIYLMLS